MRNAVSIFLLFTLSLLLMAGIFPWLLSEGFVRSLSEMLTSDPDQQILIGQIFFNTSKVSLYRWISIIPLLCFVIGVWKFKSIRTWIAENILEVHEYSIRLLRSALHYFHSLKRWQKIVTIGCILIFILFKIFSAQYYYFIVDEVFSYLYFVDKGVLVTATYYPAPNNHILYLEVCSLLNYIIPDPVWVMRLPAVFFGFTLSIVLYLVLLRHAGFNAAIIGFLLSTFHPSLHYYTLHGRGYILLSLLVFLAGYFLYRWYVYKEKNALWYFIVLSIAAFYTIPVYLYFFSGLMSMAFIKTGIRRSYQDWPMLVKGVFIVVVITLILYTPVILLNGASALVANDWVQSLDINNDIVPGIFGYVSEVVETGSGIITGKWEALLLLLLFFIAATVSKSTKVTAFVTVFLLAIGIFFIQRVFPFARTWVPLSAGFCILFVMINTRYLKWIGWQFLFLIAFAGTYIGEFYYFSVSTEDYYYKQLYEFVYRLNPDEVKSVYSRDDSYQLVMRYRFHEEKKELKVYDSLTEATETASLIILPAMMATDITGAGTMEKCYSNNFVDVYKKTGKDVLMKSNE